MITKIVLGVGSVLQNFWWLMILLTFLIVSLILRSFKYAAVAVVPILLVVAW